MNSSNKSDLLATASRPEVYNFPGFKDGDTGFAAARDIAKDLGRLQRMVANVVADRGALGVTPEETSEILDMARVSVQPRFSELKAKGVIVDSKLRRMNASSRKRAVVYVLPQYAPADPSDA